MSLRFWLASGSLSALSLACLSGCSDTESTTGKRVVLHTQITADQVLRSTFTTGFDWDVTLTRAKVAAGAFYYFDGPPPTASYRAPRRSFGERLSNFFVGTAWAHPGHYQAGTGLGEAVFSKPVAFDLFRDGKQSLDDGDGVTGTYRSARFVFADTPPDDDVLDGHLAVAEGKALKHGEADATPIYFRLIADYDDIAMSIKNGAVDGCVLDKTVVEGDGTVTVEVRPTVWLNLVDFSKLEPGRSKKPTEARETGFSQGITELSAYHFSYAQE